MLGRQQNKNKVTKSNPPPPKTKQQPKKKNLKKPQTNKPKLANKVIAESLYPGWLCSNERNKAALDSRVLLVDPLFFLCASTHRYSKVLKGCLCMTWGGG